MQQFIKKTCAFLFYFTLFFVQCNGDTECPNVYSQGDRRTNKNKLTLMQYNVEWLFIDHYSNFDCPGSKCTWKNESEAKKHMSYVSDVIKKINPDIINLCEVEGCDELNMLVDSLDNSYRPYLKFGTDTGTGQNVGMITRIDPLVNLYRTENKYTYPIKNSTCGYSSSTSSTGVSKHYITEFNFKNISIAMISAHLIAIPTDPSRCAQREAQASILRQIISNYIDNSYEIIMIGDFNDFDNKIPDINSNKPTSHVLDIIKGYYDNLSSKYILQSVASKIPQKERYSDWWDSDNNCSTSSKLDYSMIDYILVTNGINNFITNAYVYHGYKEYCGKYNSDHYPLIVELNI